ncbi:MAG: hypothetical protein NTY53_19805 [Kiritimatiellaeota bacterium]|nr:hypothetical protein [Kiritimatiellota bacterium]
MMRTKFIGGGFLLVLALCCAAPPATTESWVRVGADGKLIYRADARGNRIPDFSNVGYRGGGVALPDVPVKVTVEPGEGDAGARIQAALDQVAKLPADANGRRGAVLLKKGRYPIQGNLHLTSGGVVLRGEGQGEDGTVLIATGAKQRSLIVVGGKAARISEDDEGAALAVMPAGKNSHRRITDVYVPVGVKRFHVDNAAGLRVGLAVVVKRPSTAEWIRELGMDRIPQNKEHTVVQWKPGSKDLLFERTLTALTGNEVTVNAPLVCALEQKYGGGELLVASADDAVRECGVENLRGDSEFKGAEDEKHGWVLVDVTTARDSWVRHVTSIHFGYSCVNVHKGSRALTIENCECLDPVSQITGGRRYSFALDGALALVQHCYARNGRHDFVMHALAVGPNVFFDCTAEQAHADSGPHHRWSVGVLYDNVHIKGASKGGGLNIRNRGGSGTGHGWAGANQVAWNCEAPEMAIQQPPTAQNWAIGCRAAKQSGNAYWESFGASVLPKSLYEAQLRDRLSAAK